MDEQYKMLTYFYIRPWCRIPPYLIGMATCHLLAKWNYKLHLSKVMFTICSLDLYFSASFNNVIKFMFQKTLIVGWSLAILCNCSILLGVTNKNISLGLSALYLALSRTGWAVGIAWLVVACTTNNGGKSIFFKSLINAIISFFLLQKYFLSNAKWLMFCKLHPSIFVTFAGIVNKILSLDIFVPLGKLTYGAYLIHCIIIYLLYSSNNYSLFFYYTNTVSMIS